MTETRSREGVPTLEELIDLRRRLPPVSMRRPIREAQGVSGAQLGAHIQVTPQAISNWERGTRTPDPAHLRAYVEALELLRSAS